MSSTCPRPHPSRCNPSLPNYQAIIDAHEAAVAKGESTYRDPTTGLWVLTVAVHLARGACCDSGCRHCPFITDEHA